MTNKNVQVFFSVGEKYLQLQLITDVMVVVSWSSSNFFRDCEQVSTVLGILTAGGAGGNISSTESRLAAN